MSGVVEERCHLGGGLRPQAYVRAKVPGGVVQRPWSRSDRRRTVTP
jgi:hypothetical protein